MKPKTFEQFLEANPYQNTRSFTKEDWESSMYEKWKDESKEVKEGGEGFEWDDELKNIVDSDGYTVASLSNKRNVPFKDYQINGPLLAQSKNMYYALKDLLELAKKWSDGVMFPTLINAEETLKKANPNYLK